MKLLIMQFPPTYNMENMPRKINAEHDGVRYVLYVTSDDVLTIIIIKSDFSVCHLCSCFAPCDPEPHPAARVLLNSHLTSNH
jgi:hypothetical protein